MTLADLDIETKKLVVAAHVVARLSMDDAIRRAVECAIVEQRNGPLELETALGVLQRAVEAFDKKHEQERTENILRFLGSEEGQEK